MNSLEQLQKIFEPFKKSFQDLNNSNHSERLNEMHSNYIILLLKAFKDSPIEIVIKEASKKHLKYEIYWVDRRKYFKVFKKELIKFFDAFIKVIHGKNLTLVDMRLQENRKIIMLIERRDDTK